MTMKNLIVNTIFKRAVFASLEAGRYKLCYKFAVFSASSALLRRAEARLAFNKGLYYSTGKGRLEGIDF